MKFFRVTFVFMIFMLHIIAQAAPLKSTADGWLTFGGIQGCGGGSDSWTVYGKVYATAIGSRGELYVGGDFTFCGDVVVNHIARYENGHWYALGSDKTNGVDDIVNAIAIGPRGELYVGGNFTQAGGQAANHIAQWNGSSWSPLGTGNANGVDDLVQALTLAGSTLYVGGRFTQAGGQAANRVAQWNGSSWSSLGTGNANGVNDLVKTLTISGSTLYAGGKFTQAGGQTANHIARWNGSSWSPLGTTGNANGVNDLVQALTISGSTLYVGGSFTQAGGQTVNNIAQWNGSSWSSLGTGVNGSEVRSLIVSDSTLYVGGHFSIMGVPNSAYLAQWDIGSSRWSSLGSSVGEVYTLAISDQTLYAGGGNIAQWSGSTWYPLISNGGNGMNGSVADLTLSGSTLYVGGNFTRAGGKTAQKIAQWDGSSWYPLDTGTKIQTTNSVSTLAVSGQNLYIGGSFVIFSDRRVANHITQWDGSSWFSLANPQTSSWGVIDDIHYNDDVLALAISGSNLYVGGQFNKASNQEANNIAQWNGSSWSSLGAGITGVTGYSNSAVNALAISDQILYVGGQFTQAGGQSANNIAQWDTTLHTWLPLRSTFGDEGVPGTVEALALAKKTSVTQIINGQLAVGGQFTAEIHSRLHPACLAMWDPTYGEWRNIAPTDLFSNSCHVYSMIWLNDELYIGGSGLSSDPDAPDYYLARLKFSRLGTTLIATRVPLGRGVNGPVFALTADASKNLIYVGGNFNRVGVGGRVSSNIAIWQKNVVFQNGLEPDNDN